jgi:hypothetical protein
MNAEDKIAVAVLVIVGCVFGVFGAWPQLRAGISGTALLFGMSGVFTATGVYLFASADSRAERFSPRLMASSGLRRLWIPPRFYTVRGLSLLYRLAGALMVTLALLLLLKAFVAFENT